LKVKKLEHILGLEWDITPAGGATGEAFLARHEDTTLFLKRNSSPFLAVLSAEGIVPKLYWTKRLENGDVITAQQWLKGRDLKPGDMIHSQVAKLLNKIHQSKPLLSMLRRLGKSPILPENMLNELKNKIDDDLRKNPIIKKTVAILERDVHDIYSDDWVVCHTDVNHNNFILSDDNELYLIDWDNAMIGDRAIDIGLVLHWYIPKDRWMEWLGHYGIEMNPSLEKRMKWYVLLQTISLVQWYKDRKHCDDMNRWLQFLKKLCHS